MAIVLYVKFAVGLCAVKAFGWEKFTAKMRSPTLSWSGVEVRIAPSGEYEFVASCRGCSNVVNGDW
jgi:hypothetical protein